MSKALHRFTKEDPTFRAGVDPESRRDDHLGHGRAAPRRLRRAHEARVRRRGRDRPPQVAYRETITAARRVQLHPQEADRRLRPVRPGRRLRRAAPPSGELRVRRRGQRRLDPRRVHPVRREGLPVDDRQGPPDRASRSSACASCSTTAVPRGRLVGHRVPGGGPRRLARGLRRGKAESPRADHERRGRGPDRVPGRRADDAHAAPRHDHRSAGERGLDRRRGRGAARRDVRLRDPIRSATQGKAEFTMEFSRYAPVPEALELELVEKAAEKAKAS